MSIIREATKNDRGELDLMQFELQKYFSEIDSTKDSLPYRDTRDAHTYMQKMLDDAKNMHGKVFVAEEDNQIVGFVQGVIIEHKEGEDTIYDLSHNPSKEGWVGLLYVKPGHRKNGVGQKLLDNIKDYFKSENCTSMRLLVLSDNKNAINLYEKNGFLHHDLELVAKI